MKSTPNTTKVHKNDESQNCVKHNEKCGDILFCSTTQKTRSDRFGNGLHNSPLQLVLLRAQI